MQFTKQRAHKGWADRVSQGETPEELADIIRAEIDVLKRFANMREDFKLPSETIIERALQEMLRRLGKGID